MSMIDRNTLVSVSATALTTSFAGFSMGERDDRCVLVLIATDDCTVTVSGGNGTQAAGDLTLTIADEGTYLIRLDSGRYKMVSGENKGKILLKASAASTVSAALVTLL